MPPRKKTARLKNNLSDPDKLLAASGNGPALVDENGVPPPATFARHEGVKMRNHAIPGSGDSPQAIAMEERRRIVLRLYLSNYTERAIAVHLGVSPLTIQDDIQDIRREYRMERRDLLDREGAKLDDMEWEAIRGFKKSPTTDWLMARLKIMQRRAEMFGLDEPSKSSGGVIDGSHSVDIRHEISLKLDDLGVRIRDARAITDQIIEAKALPEKTE